MDKLLRRIGIVCVSILLVSCGGKASSSNAFDLSSLKTIGDVLALDTVNQSQYGFTDKYYAYVFEKDGVYYRASADIPSDVSKEIWDIDFEDENREEKINALLNPLPLKAVENLSEQIPPQSELDKYVGKTGQELFDEGWSYNYYNLEDMEAGLDHGPFSYRVKFNYDGEPMENTDDFDFYEAFKDLTVASIAFDGLGDATNLDGE